jgi:hypothetical protein
LAAISCRLTIEDQVSDISRGNTASCHIADGSSR